jgi:hypothetical protein
MKQNRNYVFDEQVNAFIFLRCPRSFLKTDMPAKAPRKDCPFRGHDNWAMTNPLNGMRCYLPSGLRYAEKHGIDIWKTERICYRCKGEYEHFSKVKK